MKNVYKLLMSISIVSWMVVVPSRAATFYVPDIHQRESNSQVKYDESFELDQVKPIIKAANKDRVLSIQATATNLTDAKGTVIEHTEMTALDTTQGIDESTAGKEFYTIQTKSEKVFYLIIDKSKKENNVYLLTEVSENDLLNFSDSKSEVLPQNSAVVESEVPISSNTTINKDVSNANEESVNIDENTSLEEKNIDGTGIESKPLKPNNKGNYIMIVIVALVVGGTGYYVKFVKGKKDRFDDEFEEEEEEEENEEIADEILEDDE